MNLLKPLLLIAMLCLTTITLAQTKPNLNSREALGMGLYPPDTIMRHQQALGISADQRRDMAEAVRQFQSEVAELQWNLQSEQQTLKQLLQNTRVDTNAASVQVDKVLALETRFKKAHFRLLIAVKNDLTEQQIGLIEEKLKKRRAETRGQ